jgi:7,8-dihydropterin-6-yl-methyl-4-(beta-D-ribofuranosyl)aminobenzene 5'-phosphate synthase
MKITIVNDNEVSEKKIGLQSDWGFSCIVKTNNENILFDTGAKGEILLNNMEKLDIKPIDITTIVISHEHWDHNGGLKNLISVTKDVKLYRLGGESPSENLCLFSAEKPYRINEDIYSTGRLTGRPTDEQSLIIKGKTGRYILVGCSHPGVKTILNAVKPYGEIKGIIGGFHGFSNFHLFDNLELICASHCTQYKKKIQKLFPKKYIESGVGKSIEI